MEKSFTTKYSSLLWVGLVILTQMLGACQKEDSKINSPLTNTTWKLVGFANAKTGRIKLAEPVGEECFTLIFQENEGLSGHTSTNQAKGQYKLATEEGQEISINNFGPITYINELYDGRRYIEEMNKVYSFNISHQGLSLYYGSDQYLLFRPFVEN